MFSYLHLHAITVSVGTSQICGVVGCGLCYPFLAVDEDRVQDIINYICPTENVLAWAYASINVSKCILQFQREYWGRSQ